MVKTSVSKKNKESPKTQKLLPTSKNAPAMHKSKGSLNKSSTPVSSQSQESKMKSIKDLSSAAVLLKKQINTLTSADPNIQSTKVSAVAAAFAAHRAQSSSSSSSYAIQSNKLIEKKINFKMSTAVGEGSDQVTVPKDIAEKTAANRTLVSAQKKPVNQRHGFKTNEFIVYPTHGVGRIIGIEEQEIAGMSLELFVINFEKEKLTLRVPTGKLESVGMRKLADDDIVKKAMDILKGRARIKRTMWSRRAQEYIAKINSGDRKSTRLNSSHVSESRMPSSA